MGQEIIGTGWAFPPQIDSTGGLGLTSDECELSQAIQIILSTMPGQRVMRPNFGCKLHELVFFPNNGYTAALARSYVEEALGMWEPRIRLTRVAVTTDSQDSACMVIQIAYEVIATHDRRSLVYPFYLNLEENS